MSCTTSSPSFSSFSRSCGVTGMRPCLTAAKFGGTSVIVGSARAETRIGKVGAASHRARAICQMTPAFPGVCDGAWRLRSLTSRTHAIDNLDIMSLDLNDLLRDWPHEPGTLKVR